MARRKAKGAGKHKLGSLARLGTGAEGASDDDPSGIGTYSQAGAQLGFGIGWTMPLSYPLMTAIQDYRDGPPSGPGTRGIERLRDW